MVPEQKVAGSNSQSGSRDMSSRGSEVTNRDAWALPPAQIIPQPTYAPAAMSLGIAFVFFGLVTSYLFCAAGGLIMVVALRSWIGGMTDGE
jgi:hypothetical protein